MLPLLVVLGGTILTGAWQHMDDPWVAATLLSALVLTTQCTRAQATLAPVTIGAAVMFPFVAGFLTLLDVFVAWWLVGFGVLAAASNEVALARRRPRSRALQERDERAQREMGRVIGFFVFAAFIAVVLLTTGPINALQIGFILFVVFLAFRDVDGWNRMSRSWQRRRRRRRALRLTKPLRVVRRRKRRIPGPPMLRRTFRRSARPAEASVGEGAVIVAVLTIFFLFFFQAGSLDPFRSVSDSMLVHTGLVIAAFSLLVFGPRWLRRRTRRDASKRSRARVATGAWRGLAMRGGAALVLLLVAVNAVAGIARGRTAREPVPTDDPYFEHAHEPSEYAPVKLPADDWKARRLALALDEMGLGRTDLEVRDDHLLWRSAGGRRFVLRPDWGADRAWHADVPGGTLLLERDFLMTFQAGPPPEMDQLLAHVAATEVGVTKFRARYTALLGPHLRGREWIVLPEGPLSRRMDEEFGEGHEQHRLLRELDRATRAFVRGLTDTPLDPSSRRAAAEVLTGLQPGKAPKRWAGLDPAIVRRLIRHGWLDAYDADPPLVSRLRKAVREAERLRPIRIWRGTAGEIVDYEDLLGQGASVLRTNRRSKYARPQPQPQWLPKTPERLLVVELDAGIDPLAASRTPRRLSVSVGGVCVASWTPGHGFQAGTESWGDGMVRFSGRLASPFPCHILHTDVQGDVLALLTAHGTLRPARDGSPEALRRFRREAAAALPDAMHLDLLGELLFDYAWDGAEPGQPQLVGTRHHGGDWNQSPSATLATTAGGRMRGDCDDLAILYQDLLSARGELAHVLDLPRHAACGWLEQDSGRTWRVHVLHTGRPLAFPGSTPSDALCRVYEAFQAIEILDANALPVVVRLDGETDLRPVRVGVRAFQDAPYARAMRSVHQDLVARTYAGAIATLRGLRTHGPQGAADGVLLGRAQRLAGEHEKALATLRAAYEQGGSASTRLAASLEMLEILAVRAADAEVDAYAVALIEEEIPLAERERGATLVSPWVTVVGALAGRKGLRDRALRILAADVQARLDPSLAPLSRLLVGTDYEPHWLHVTGNPTTAPSRAAYFKVAVRILPGGTDGLSKPAQRAWRRVDMYVRRYLQNDVFGGLSRYQSPLDPFAILAAYHAAHLGERVIELQAGDVPDLAQVDLPKPEHLRGREPRAEHLSCIRCSSSYWRGVWSRMLRKPAAELDRIALAGVLKMQCEAGKRAEQLGMAHWREHSRTLLARLTYELLFGNEKTFQWTIAEVAARRDQRLEDDVARMLGEAAPHVAPARYKRSLEQWSKALGHARNGFVVAWFASKAGAGAQALQAARLAAARHPNRPAFQTELARYEKRFAAK